MKITSPIIVIGTPRSGTSLTAGILHHCGAWVGECRKGDKYNPRGYFENEEIRKLRKRGEVCKASIKRVLASQRWKDGAWMYKSGPFEWKVWVPFDPIWVLVYRDNEQIMRSRRERGGIDESEEREKIARDMRDMQQILTLFPDSTIETWPHELVQDRQARVDLVESCGLKYRDEADQYIDEGMLHQ